MLQFYDAFTPEVCVVLFCAGAVSRLERTPGLVAWCTDPEKLVPGKRAKLFYNASAGPLAFMAPLPTPPSIIIGHNGWLDTQVRASVLIMSL
jgi:hypothetical protein